MMSVNVGSEESGHHGTSWDYRPNQK